VDTLNVGHFSVEHPYASLGSYNVQLFINSECGSKVLDTIIHVVNNLQATAYLGIDYNSQFGVCPGTPVYFNTDWSAQNYLINYGDGTYGTNGSHSYENFGTYYPSVTITNTCGNTASASSAPIVVTTLSQYSGQPSAGASNGGEINSFCPSTPVDFWAAEAQSYHWNFGDGDTSGLRNPSHIFNAPGTYNVSVKLTDGCANDTVISFTVNIVTNLPVSSMVTFENIPSEICVGDPLVFDLNGAYQYQTAGSIYWSFGDGTYANTLSGQHSYQTSGVYTIQCTITNGCGSDTTLTTQITAGTNVPPAIDFFTPQNSYCPGDEVLLVATPYSSSFTINWDLDNGNIIPIQDTILVSNEEGTTTYYQGVYVYSTPGVYTTTASVTNACGLSTSQEIIVNIGNGATIQEAGFFLEGNEYICLGEEVVFRGYGGTDYYWYFGDETGLQYSANTLEEVTHSFEEPGVYLVRMIAKNACGDTMLVKRNIVIPDSKMDIVTNSIDANCLQSNGTAVAYVLGPNAPYNFVWSNGQTTNVASNLSAGLYVVNVEDSKGCKSFAIATVSDEEAPVIAVSNVIPVSCFGEDNGAIDITPIGNTSGITYEWSNGETSQDVSGLVAGPYEIFATNGQGCVSVASITVTEPDEVLIDFSTTQAVCGYASGTASAIVTGTTGPYLYLWSDNQTGATATGLAGGVYSVTVIDNESCLTQASIAISETNSPMITVDSVIQAGCGSAGSSIYITPIGGTQPYTYLWSNAQTTDDVNGLSPGQYYVKVYGDDGCYSTKLFDIDYEVPETDAVCVVTVTNSQNNKIAWEKYSASDISYYNIYRESSEAGLYYNIGRVPYDSLSVFVDTVSNPAVQSYRYKVAAVDNCGTESDLSSHHKTIHLTQNVGISGEVNLIWDSYEGFSYATYNILRYDNVDGWQQLTSLPSNVNSYSDYQAPTATATSLHYLIEVVLDQACVSTKIENNNTTRSNRTEPIAGPIEETGLEKLVRSNELMVYPNPANKLLNVRISIGNGSDVKLMMLDGQGREVMTQSLDEVTDGYELELDISEFDSGIYSLWIISDGQRYQKRITIQN
jgi:PKD repeat protein